MDIRRRVDKLEQQQAAGAGSCSWREFITLSGDDLRALYPGLWADWVDLAEVGENEPIQQG